MPDVKFWIFGQQCKTENHVITSFLISHMAIYQIQDFTLEIPD